MAEIHSPVSAKSSFISLLEVQKNSSIDTEIMTLILTKDELARMRRSVQDNPADLSALERKAELKKKSEERLKHWPNTLDAIRKKKENYVKEKAEQEELRRQEIDKQEAELRRIARVEAIRKANELLYEQTDKMKLLRSQQLYADVIHTRKSQIEEKQRVKEVLKEEDKKHHQHILEAVSTAEQKEKEKIERQKQLIEEVKVSRKEQLEEVKAIREAAKEKVIQDGLRMKQQAQEQLQEEIRNYELRQKMIAESNAKMVIANEELKKVKDEIREKEKQAEYERDQEIAKIENRKMMLKHLEKQRFEKAQVTRQKLIDTAVQLLSEKTNTEEKLLAQQMQDLQDKEDRLLAEKKARDEQFREVVAKSRLDQIEAREAEKRRLWEEENHLVQKWRLENEEAMQAEVDKQRRAREETIRIKQMQYDDGLEAARRKKEEKMLEIEQARFLHSIRGNDDARFIELCKQEIERNVALGKPVYTLLRALEYSQPVLIPAKTVKKPREKEGGATAGK